MRTIPGVVLCACFVIQGVSAFSAVAQVGAPRPEYRIGVEDVLEVNVWKDPEVSRQVWVRPDGRITIPMVGEVVAEGRTPSELQEVLTEKFKEYLTDPLVTVSVIEINSYTIYLLGRVQDPGALKLKSPKTFLQVLAMAGGFEEFADSGNVLLVRWEGGKETRVPVDARKMIAKGTEQDFLLRPGDVIIVP